MEAIQIQARALGDPTRHAIFRYVAGAGRPVRVAELTEHFGLNHNAIRAHLGKLTAAHLLEENQAPRSGPGRPALEYRVASGVDSRWGVVGPYERLSLLLAEMARTGASAEEVGRRSIAASDAVGAPGAPGADPLDQVVDAMRTAGFDPTVRTRGARCEIVLHACPFAGVARVEPDIVCAIHLGMARGVAECTDGAVHVDGLVVGDPGRRDPRCRLQVSLAPHAAA